MPALISHIYQTFRPSASAKLQAAQHKADLAIQKLRQSGDQDVAEVLIARYEELKQRHDRLLKLQGTTSTDEPSTTSTGEVSTGEDEETSARQVNIDQLEDGTFQLTCPPDEAHEQPRVFILTSPAFQKDQPTQNIIVMAEELISAAMVIIGDNEQDFQESQIEYLMNMYESLTSQKGKIDSLEKTEASPVALEIAAQLYLTDAFRYLQSAQMILNINKDVERSGWMRMAAMSY